MNTDWFVAYTTASGERLAAEDLEEAGFTAFLPLEVVTLRPAKHRRDQRKKVVSRPLFGRYLFVGLPRGWHDFSGVRRSRRIVDFLRDSHGCPLRIDASVVEAIRADMSQGKYDEAQTKAAKEAERLRDVVNRTANIRPGHTFTTQNGMWRGFLATVTRVREREIRIEIKGVDGATLSLDVPASRYEEVGLLS
jgi:transcription antitermination factor NusG